MKRFFIFMFVLLFILLIPPTFSKVTVSKSDEHSAMWTANISREEFISRVENLIPPNKPGEVTNTKDGYERFFRPYAKDFFDIARMHGLNPMYVFALGIQESNWGTSDIANSKSNIFNFGMDYYDSTNDSPIYSSSIDAIEEVCTLLEEYSTPGSWEYEIISAGGYDPKTIEGQCYMYSNAAEKHVKLNKLINEIFYRSN